MTEQSCSNCHRPVGSNRPYTYLNGKLLCMNCYHRRQGRYRSIYG